MYIWGKNHGHEFGIQSTPNSKGRFKTEKTLENIQAFKEEIKNLFEMENELKVHIEKLNQMAIQLVIFTTRKLEKTLFLKKTQQNLSD